MAPPQTGIAEDVTQHVLPELPYSYDALEPYIDARTVEIHHDKHHAAYVNGLNAAEAALANAREKQDFSLVQHWARQAAFHGGGHFLHSLYWVSMAPPQEAGSEPSGVLADRIRQDFRDFDTFKAQFAAAAGSVEANGWVMLAYRPLDDRLLILQVENHQKLSPWNVMPVLVLDLWEHAYYLKYQNARPDYVKAWWNIANWEKAAENFSRMARM